MPVSQCERRQAAPPLDRRRHPRLGFDCPLRWTDGGPDRMAWVRDISEQGVGLVTRGLSTPKPGQQIHLVAELDDERDWLIDPAATVVRAEPIGNGLYSVGVFLSEGLPQ